MPSLGLLHEFPVFLANQASKLRRACLELSSYETREVGRIFAGELARPAMLPASVLLALVGFLLRVTGSKEVIVNEICYFAAQPLAGGEVEAEMLAGEDAA